MADVYEVKEVKKAPVYEHDISPGHTFPVDSSQESRSVIGRWIDSFRPPLPASEQDAVDVEKGEKTKLKKHLQGRRLEPMIRAQADI
jgi:hypothetical protein